MARACGGTVAGAVMLAECLAAAGRAEPPLDPIQRAVVDSLDASLGLPDAATPGALLDAAIKAADVEALAAAERYLARVASLADEAGAAGPDLLADLADSTDEASLLRLDRAMLPRQRAASRLVRRILEAGRARRRDSGILGQAADDLASPDLAARRAAAERLSRAGIDALPALVPLLDPAREPGPARDVARGLVARLGPEARQPLLDWLGTGDPTQWAAVIEALRAADAADVEHALLAPALVPGTPLAARAAAKRFLEARASARGRTAVAVPTRTMATEVLAARLDRLLMPTGLPFVDHLSLEPVEKPAQAASAFGGTVSGTVDRRFWNPQTGSFDPVAAPPRVARAREAMHLARDLQALAVDDEATVDLVLLARLEALLVTGGDPLTVLERVPPQAVREALSGPGGFSVETAGRVFEQAVERGLWQAAAAATTALVPESGSAAGLAGTPGTLPPAVREGLVRALAVPDIALQFAAARALVLAAGDPPYHGSSRVLETLLYAATSTGADRVIVAHPDLGVAHELAAGVSRFGYEPVRVSTGRQAIFAARGSADTVLVILAARLVKPTALETTQFLQQQGLGDIPAVLVVVDPLDDDGRGKYLTRTILAFCDLDRVAIIDRLDSVFEPVLDPATGAESLPARFPDLLAQAAGPAAVDPTSRNTAAAVRLARAREALTLLARLGRRGQDVSPALETAQIALLREELHAPAASLLASIGRAEAQGALEQEAARADLPEAAHLVAKSAFEASVERWGILLDSRQMLAAYGRYNRPADDTARRAAGDILDVLEAAGRKNPISPADAAPLHPRW
ncbi:MAG: hypothetical protein ACKOCX_10915 [Planctomycetota bacterium]